MKKSSQKFRFVRYSYRSVDGKVIHSEATFSPAVLLDDAQALLRSQFAGSATPLLSINDTPEPVPEPAPPPPFAVTDVRVQQDGSVVYKMHGLAHDASFPLLIIRAAWVAGADFEDLADGFGPGGGTMGGDWSGIRDSSSAAINRMLERAMNHLHIG